MTETANRSTRRYIAWMVVAMLVVIADQGTKWAIVEWVDLYGRVPINSFINLTHQQNSGAAFSFLAGAGGWQRWFFVVLATIVSAVIAVWLWRIRTEGPLVLMAGLSLVLGGAVGNLIDRARLGYVTDLAILRLSSSRLLAATCACHDHRYRRSGTCRLQSRRVGTLRRP